MANVDITGVSIRGQGWHNDSGIYQGSKAYGLQEALSIAGFGSFGDSFDGLSDVSDVRGF